MQLLGRAYLRKNLVNEFEHVMAEAEQLAQTFDPQTCSTQGHYSFGVVYEKEDYHLRKQREIRHIGPA